MSLVVPATVSELILLVGVGSGITIDGAKGAERVGTHDFLTTILIVLAWQLTGAAGGASAPEAHGRVSEGKHQECEDVLGRHDVCASTIRSLCMAK